MIIMPLIFILKHHDLSDSKKLKFEKALQWNIMLSVNIHAMIKESNRFQIESIVVLIKCLDN